MTMDTTMNDCVSIPGLIPNDLPADPGDADEQDADEDLADEAQRAAQTAERLVAQLEDKRAELAALKATEEARIVTAAMAGDPLDSDQGKANRERTLMLEAQVAALERAAKAAIEASKAAVADLVRSDALSLLEASRDAELAMYQACAGAEGAIDQLLQVLHEVAMKRAQWREVSGRLDPYLKTGAVTLDDAAAYRVPRLTIPNGVSTVDRSTGLTKPEFKRTPEQEVETLRQMFENSVIRLAVDGDVRDIGVVHRLHVWRDALARLEAEA